MSGPTLRKARLVAGKSLRFRDAVAADAPFILELRTDERKSQYLSQVSNELADQVSWLERYAQRQGEAYFVIETMDGQPLGTVRLYDARGDSFCWGSWVLKDGAPSSAAIESALMVYAYAIDVLGFSQAHFQVRRDNERVWAFHERFGATRVAQDDIEFQYTLANAAIRASMRRFAKFLPGALTVEH